MDTKKLHFMQRTNLFYNSKFLGIWQAITIDQYAPKWDCSLTF